MYVSHEIHNNTLLQYLSISLDKCHSNSPILHLLIVLLDHPKLRLQNINFDIPLGYPKLHLLAVILDLGRLLPCQNHRPIRRSKIKSDRWSIGPLFIQTPKFCKCGRSKLRSLDQGVFLTKKRKENTLQLSALLWLCECLWLWWQL